LDPDGAAKTNGVCFALLHQYSYCGPGLSWQIIDFHLKAQKQALVVAFFLQDGLGNCPPGGCTAGDGAGSGAMVYAGKDGPVTTLRMEMLHAGIEDFLLWKRLPVAHRRRLASSLIGLRVGSASHCSGDALWQPKNTDVIFGTCMLGDAEDLEAMRREAAKALWNLTD
jgi:hypothetical protein